MLVEASRQRSTSCKSRSYNHVWDLGTWYEVATKLISEVAESTLTCEVLPERTKAEDALNAAYFLTNGSLAS